MQKHTKKNYLKIQNNSCCSDSEKATVGVAVEPNAQCFADCCPVCPPEDCCDSITINYDCLPPKAPPECTCPCVFDGFSFNENIKFKPKKTPDNAGLLDISMESEPKNNDCSHQTMNQIAIQAVDCVTFYFTHAVFDGDGAVTTQNWTTGTLTLEINIYGGGTFSETFEVPANGQTVAIDAPAGDWEVTGSLNDWAYGDGTSCTGAGYVPSAYNNTGSIDGSAVCGCLVQIRTTGTQSINSNCPQQMPYYWDSEGEEYIFDESLCSPMGGNTISQFWTECGAKSKYCKSRHCLPSVIISGCTTPTPTPYLSPTATPTRTPYLSPTATPTRTPYLSPTPTASETPTATPTPTPTPTPTEEPYYCVQKNEACLRGGCVGWYRPVACEPCVYTGAQGAPSGTEIDVYIGTNARYNCNRFEPYAPGSTNCEPSDDGSPNPWLNDHKEIDEEGLCSVGGGKINACLPVSNIDLRVWKIIDGPFDGKEACEASNCCDYEDEPTPTPTETPTPTPTPTCPACEKPSVELTFNGCCLVLEGNSIVAVGSGTVSASVSGGGECDLEVKLNGNGSSISVEDGDTVNVELTGCDCCETKRICNSGQSSLWFSTKNKIKLNKTTFLDTIKFIYNKIKKKKA